MGGTTARIAAAAVAACGLLSLVIPALASAAGPLDGAERALTPVSQEVDAAAPPATKQVVTIVRDTAQVPPPIEHATPPKGGGRGAAPATPVQPGPRSTQRADQLGAVTPIVHNTRPTRTHARVETAPPSRTHGRKEIPPARSPEERAAGAGAVQRSHTAAVPPIGPPQPGPGLTATSRAVETGTAAVPPALLIVALAASFPVLLRWLRIPAPVARRPAFVPAPGPPG